MWKSFGRIITRRRILFFVGWDERIVGLNGLAVYHNVSLRQYDVYIRDIGEYSMTFKQIFLLPMLFLIPAH